MTHCFYVATIGLATEIDQVLSEEAYWSLGPQDATPGSNWFRVTVRNPGDQALWVEAYNDLLYAQWSPNQTKWDIENRTGPMMREAQEKLAQLEI